MFSFFLVTFYFYFTATVKPVQTSLNSTLHPIFHPAFIITEDATCDHFLPCDRWHFISSTPIPASNSLWIQLCALHPGSRPVQSKSGLSELSTAICWWLFFPTQDCLKIFSILLTPRQSQTRRRAARRCRYLAVLRPRPSSTAPSAPPTGLAPPLRPPPRPLPLPRPTRAQRRANQGGAPGHSRRGADGRTGAGLLLTRDSDLYLFSVGFVWSVKFLVSQCSRNANVFLWNWWKRWNRHFRCKMMWNAMFFYLCDLNDGC